MAEVAQLVVEPSVTVIHARRSTHSAAVGVRELAVHAPPQRVHAFPADPAPRPPDRPTRRGCVAAHLAQHLGAQGGARLVEEQHTSRGAAPRYPARRMAEISLAAFEALSVHRLLDSNSDTDETVDTTLSHRMRHAAPGAFPGSAPCHVDAISIRRRAADPHVDRWADAPAGTAKAERAGSSDCMSVDSRPSPDSHPSVSGGSSDALTVGPPGRARVVRAPHRGPGTWGFW